MTNKTIHIAVAQEAAAGLATQMLLARCRTGAEVTMPQSRWLATESDHLVQWMRSGGFRAESATQPERGSRTAA